MCACHRTLALDDLADLRLEAHVEHAVGLVENEPADVREGHLAALDHVDQAAGGGHDEVGAPLNVAQLVANLGATVDDARADMRAVRELLCDDRGEL